MGAMSNLMVERANEILANRQDDSDTDDEDEEHQEQMEQHGYAQCFRCYIELHQDDLGVCDDGYICIGCNNYVEMEREEGTLDHLYQPRRRDAQPVCGHG